MKRGGPLKRNKPLKRTPWKRVGRWRRKRTGTARRLYNGRAADRKRERFKRQFGSRAYVMWIKLMRCAVGRCKNTPSECAHVKSRGSGGRWSDIVPLCHYHHRKQHDLGIERFEAHYRVKLRALADDIAKRGADLVEWFE